MPILFWFLDALIPAEALVLIPCLHLKVLVHGNIMLMFCSYSNTWKRAGLTDLRVATVTLIIPNPNSLISELQCSIPATNN